MNNEIQFSKKGKRKVSAFIGQQLLYEYITGSLDEERVKSVEEYIQQNQEVLNDINKIQNGMSYLSVLSQTKVSEALLARIKQPVSWLEVLLLKLRFDQWSQGFKIGVEASLVAIGVVFVILVLPWQKIFDFKMESSDVLLTEIVRKFESPQSNDDQSSVAATNSNSEISFPDEGSTAVVAAVTTSSTTTSTIPTTPPAAVAVAPVTATTVETRRQGYLYRGSMAITNAKAASTKLVQRLTQLGARKAGNVELGWSRDEGAYFHFTMPETNYSEMESSFNEFAPIKITKEKHERVMPEGIIRVIITVDEKK